MSTETLKVLNIIKRLSLSEKLEIIELILKSIKEEMNLLNSEAARREAAAKLLLTDYQEDEELTAFSDFTPSNNHP